MAALPGSLPAAQLQALRGEAARDPKAAVQAAARQFESLFMQELMKSMRATTPSSGLMDNGGTQLGTEMLDQQFAQQLSGLPGGLADQIARQLARQQPAATSPASSASSESPTVTAASGTVREIRMPDGSSSHNVFGIKAGPGWTGKTTTVTTTEVVDGVPRKVRQTFRAYDSYAEAYTDHARLLSQSPRYARVVAEGGSAQGFARSLQKAGYATDPDYASKLGRVIDTTLRVARSLNG